MLAPASNFFRQDPFAQFERLMRDMGRGSAGVYPGTPTFPAVNVWRNEDAIFITSELPGVELEDIAITVKDNTLTLAGERKPPEAPEGARWHLRERRYGRFSRVVKLPHAVDPDRVEARFRDGVLQVALHRPEAEKPRRIEIKAA